MNEALENLRAMNLYHAYRRGWVAGAASGPQISLPHEDERTWAEYLRGYEDATRTRDAAMVAASKRYGYQPITGSKRS